MTYTCSEKLRVRQKSSAGIARGDFDSLAFWQETCQFPKAPVGSMKVEENYGGDRYRTNDQLSGFL